MRLSGFQAAAATLFAAGAVDAQVLINELSFGHSGRMNPSGGSNIPNFAVSGDPQQPQVLSNKLVLTPIAPGNQRGSLWSDSLLTQVLWTADVEFRATGPERGGGNLNIWLARNGDREVGSSSIYTARKFDGLALVIDTHGGSGGMIRGFLNDGNIDYSQHHSVDELAFGHCLYSYRNLGRPTQIKMRQTRDNFRVEVDNKLCFETDSFSLPPGNKFGITAATPEDNPDSFEIFKLTVLSEGAGSYTGGSNTDNSNSNNNDNYDSARADAGRAKQRAEPVADNELFEDPIPDEDADVFSTSKTQFRDLHNRMQATNHQISALFRTISKFQNAQAKNHESLIDLVNSLNDRLASLDKLGDLSQRVTDIEKEMRSMRNDLGRKIQANERNFKGMLGDHHATLSQTLIDSMPGHKRLFAVVVGTQVLVAVAYVLYKRRKANMPKKYL
ncbi:concanavalin A-like lectin/glucanase [Sarocladium strictum]